MKEFSWLETFLHFLRLKVQRLLDWYIFGGLFYFFKASDIMARVEHNDKQRRFESERTVEKFQACQRFGAEEKEIGPWEA